MYALCPRVHCPLIHTHARIRTACHSLKLKRLQDDLVDMKKGRGDAVELRQRVDALAKQLEAERLEKDELAKEVWVLI